MTTRTSVLNLGNRTDDDRPALLIDQDGQLGLFDQVEALEQLAALGMTDAAQLVEIHGPARCLTAIAHGRYLEQAGEVRRSCRAVVADCLRRGYPPDQRLVDQGARQVAARRRQQQVQLEQLEAVDQAEADRRRRLIDDEVWRIMPDHEKRRHLAELIEQAQQRRGRCLKRSSVESPIVKALILKRRQEPLRWPW